jgi:hypothetical protein
MPATFQNFAVRQSERLNIMKLKSISNNDSKILAFLETCNREIRTVADHRHPLPDYFKLQVSEQLDRFRDASETLLSARSHLKSVRQEIGQQEKVLRDLLRHVLQNVRRKKNHPDLPAGLLIRFGLDDQGRLGDSKAAIPHPLQLAEQVFEANREANAFGFDFMVDPSMETVDAARAELVSLYTQRHDALAQERRLLQEITDERFQASSLIMMIRGYLVANLRGHAPSYRREVLRAYGFAFESTYAASEDEPTDDVTTSEDTAPSDDAEPTTDETETPIAA